MFSHFNPLFWFCTFMNMWRHWTHSYFDCVLIWTNWKSPPIFSLLLTVWFICKENHTPSTLIRISPCFFVYSLVPTFFFVEAHEDDAFLTIIFHWIFITRPSIRTKLDFFSNIIHYSCWILIVELDYLNGDTSIVLPKNTKLYLLSNYKQ